MEFRPIDRDEVGELLEGSRPRDEAGKQFKRESDERLKAKRLADAIDHANAVTRERELSSQLERAIRRIAWYDREMERIATELGDDHPVAERLRALIAGKTPRETDS